MIKTVFVHERTLSANNTSFLVLPDAVWLWFAINVSTPCAIYWIELVAFAQKVEMT